MSPRLVPVRRLLQGVVLAVLAGSLLALAAGTSLAAPTADPPPPKGLHLGPTKGTVKLSPRALRQFWTKRRLARARPLDLATRRPKTRVRRSGPSHGATKLTRGHRVHRFAGPRRSRLRSTEALRGIRRRAHGSYAAEVPWSNYGVGYLSASQEPPQLGRLYFTTPQGLSKCSATVVGPNVVLTAAHCVVDSNTGNYYSNWIFAPQQFGTSFPKGLWAARNAVAWAYYSTPSLRNLPGSGGLGFLPMDYAFVVLSPQGGRSVSYYTGSYGLISNASLSGSSALFTEGYPATGPFAGNCPSNSVSCYPWYCYSPYGGYAGYPAVPGWYEIAMSCYTGKGHSGGPWFFGYNGSSYVTSNLSNGPLHANSFFTTAWGPYYNDYTLSLLNYALTL